MDGSAVWLVSLAEVLARTKTEVHVQLKAEVTNPRLLARLEHLANVTVHAPPVSTEPSITPRRAAQVLAARDSEIGFDAIIVRGLRVCHSVALSQQLRPKSWLYVTDVPFPPERFSSKTLQALTEVVENSQRLLAQTEDARSYLESLFPVAAGKVGILSPMVPDEYFDLGRTEGRRADQSAARGPALVYSGKFAKDWRTLEMTELPARMQAEGQSISLTMIGDKFQDDARDKTWATRMKDAITRDGVDWPGGMERDEALRLVASRDLGLGWRSSALDSSLEISTKALEYAAAGIPPIVNRTAQHEEFFGKDYPLLVEDSADSVVQAILDNRFRQGELSRQVREVARNYSMSAAAERLERELSRHTDYRHLATSRPRALRVALAGHDLKFAGELISQLEGTSDVELRIDKWDTLHKHDETHSQELVDWADVVICEWSGPNAVWYSNHKLPGQSLIVRLHAFELRGPWMTKVNHEQIDAVVCVSEHYKQLTHEMYGWDPSKISVIGNSIDIWDFKRPKKAGYEKNLAMVGIVPFIKRPDRALSLLSDLLIHDPDFKLYIRGRAPWEYPYVWDKDAQREAYLDFYKTIGSDLRLRNSVVFDTFGADMGSWYRSMGYVLSPSTRESFHLAIAEGMSSGCIPLVWDRAGASEVFGAENVYQDQEQMVQRILQLSDDSVHRAEAMTVARAAVEKYDQLTTADAWLGLIDHVAR
ncbi:glycosyltransferase [Nesterenkonia populi]